MLISLTPLCRPRADRNVRQAARREHTVHLREGPSMQITIQDRMTNPEETPLRWRDLGEANTDKTFLFPETEDSKCPNLCEVDPRMHTRHRQEG